MEKLKYWIRNLFCRQCFLLFRGQSETFYIIWPLIHQLWSIVLSGLLFAIMIIYAVLRYVYIRNSFGSKCQYSTVFRPDQPKICKSHNYFVDIQAFMDNFTVEMLYQNTALYHRRMKSYAKANAFERKKQLYQKYMHITQNLTNKSYWK